MSSMSNSNNNYVAWEVLDLISHHLDPRTLAIASCVSKSWCSCFSSDHLWGPLCSSRFPSLSTVDATTISRRRLYAIGHAASLCRVRQPRKPCLSLDNLLFFISIRFPYTKTSPCNSLNKDGSNKNGQVVNIVKPCMDMARDQHGLFRFDIDVKDDKQWSVKELQGARVTWNVVERHWKAVFTMTEESSGKGSFVSGVDGWFSEELPSPECCSSTVSSGLVADLRLGISVQQGAESGVWGGNRGMNNNNSKLRIEKVSVGVLCVLNWRYVTLDDGLSYLDHFIKV